MNNKERRERLQSEGLCTRCAHNPAAEGRTLCDACLEYLRTYSHRRKRNGGHTT